METTNEIIVKRMRLINQLAEDINEINDEALPVEKKYRETMYFVGEILRTATGLADLEEEIMTYGVWQ